MIAWSGVSHKGNLPAVCSINTATKRSIDPKGAGGSSPGDVFDYHSLYTQVQTCQEDYNLPELFQLPFSPQSILHHEIHLRAIKSSFPTINNSVPFSSATSMMAFSAFSQFSSLRCISLYCSGHVRISEL